jgi:hypothetical protein
LPPVAVATKTLQATVAIQVTGMTLSSGGCGYVVIERVSRITAGFGEVESATMMTNGGEMRLVVPAGSISPMPEIAHVFLFNE